jgi:protein TonB
VLAKDGFMKFRSSLFLTLSLIVHAACISALALSHFKGLESPKGDSVEMTLGEGSVPTDTLVAANDLKTDVQPVIRPVEPAPVKEAPLPKKAVATPKAVKKVAKVKALPAPIATELPAKTEPTSEPENMNPNIEDTDAVAVATVEETKAEETKEETPKEEAPKFVPVKEKVAAQPDTEAEDKTEASAVESQVKDPAPQPQGAAGPLGQGGDSKSEAVSYLELKQFSGNKPPEYPLSARKDARQGEVGLLYRVAKDGRVAEVQIAKSSGHSDLDDAAVKAVSKFKFVPGQEGWAKQPVVFKLTGVASALPSKLRSGKSAATE